MLSPDELERIPTEFQIIWNQTERNILSDIIKRIAMAREITSTADMQIYRLNAIGVSSEYIRQEIQRALKLSDGEIETLYSKTIKESYVRDKALYETNTSLYVPFEQNIQLQQLIEAVKEQTRQEFLNITNTTGFRIIQNGKVTFTPLANYLQNTLDRAMVDLSSGAYDATQIINKSITELANSGIRTVDYASGKTDSIEVVVRRAVMTGSNQISNYINEFNAEKLNTDLFEVSWHKTARPTHQVWQGRVYSREDLISVCGLGDVTGLNGANCYHSYHPFIEGVSKRMYTDEELDKMNAEENKQKEFNGKLYTSYEATQEMRRMERAMRKAKKKLHLQEVAEVSKEDINATKARYRLWNTQYKEFAKAMGLPEQRQRIYVGGR